MRLPLLLAAALAGCAQSPAETARVADRAADQQARLARELAGLTPTGTSACLTEAFPTGQTKGYGSTILYKFGRNRLYRTETNGGCDNIARGDILVTRSPSGRTCSGDIATTIDRASRAFTGSCSLGEFTRYERRR